MSPAPFPVARKRPFWVCLMYHDVLPDANRNSDYFAVPAHRFSEHLAGIEAAGFNGVSLGEVLHSGRTPSVAITFDDATSSQIEEALPRLIERRMTATFFVVTSWVGKPGYASWEDLRRLKAHGMEVQSHTHSHPFLSELDSAEVEAELRQSREILNAHLDQDTRILALPGGDFPSPGARSLIASAGYTTVATSIFGLNSDPPRESPGVRYVQRCTIRGDADADAVRRIVDGERLLFLRRQGRETVLRNLRVWIGPTRYARFRRRFFKLIRPIQQNQ